MSRKRIVIAMLVIGGTLLVCAFIPYIVNPELEDNPLFLLGFIGILIMIMSSAVAGRTTKEDEVNLNKLRTELNIPEVIIEEKEDLGYGNITQGKWEFSFIAEKYGYNLNTVSELLNEYKEECKGRTILVNRRKTQGSAFDTWYMYASTGRLVSSESDKG